jgi:uncharacterized membrane protein YuzA (DUF378 family)
VRKVTGYEVLTLIITIIACIAGVVSACIAIKTYFEKRKEKRKNHPPCEE